jgi:MFS family permease
MRERNRRNILLISASQFGMGFSFNFVLVFLPFLIHKISPYPPAQTLVWIGLIVGAPSFAAAVFSTFWGSLAARYSPKRLFMRGLLSHALLILCMGFFSNLPILFALRLAQGVLGGISTVGFLIVSSSSTPEHAPRDIGLYQNAMTLGQLTGPPIGALAASALGYRGAFTSAAGLIFLTLVFCLLFVKDVPRQAGEKGKAGRSVLRTGTLAGWALCFTATIQLMFLPSVLPNVFRGFGVGHEEGLKLAGLVVMLYTGAAMIGTHVLCRLSGRVGTKRLILTAGAVGVCLQAALALSPGLGSFVALRMLQTAVIAATLPLVFSTFANDLDGRVIGFLNSGRFAGNSLGPMIGTAVLAATNLPFLYLAVSGIGLLSLLGYAYSSRAQQEPSGF